MGVGGRQLLHFVEEPGFTKDWQDLGLDAEHDLWDLQDELSENPKAWPAMAGTGGLRKARFSPAGWNRGKSGATRVCYVYFESHGIVVLYVCYGKGQKVTLTRREKADFKAAIEATDKLLKTRKPRR